MDKKTEKVLDLVYADKIDVEEAAKALNMSIEEVFELADEYDYIPTSEEVIEACKIERETIDHIKFTALQKIETKVRSKMFKPQLLIAPLIKKVSVSTCGEEKSWADFVQHSFMKAMSAKFGELPEEKRREFYVTFKPIDLGVPLMKISEKIGTDRGDISSTFEVLTQEA